MDSSPCFKFNSNSLKKPNIMTIGTERCLCIMELNVIGIIGIEVELPSSELELELNCLDFVPESELNWNCFYRNWN